MEPDEREPFNLIADEIAARRNRGERPTLKKYVDRYPGLADRLRRVFPLLLLMEDAGPDVGSHSEQRREPQGIEDRELGDYRILRELGRGGSIATSLPSPRTRR